MQHTSRHAQLGCTFLKVQSKEDNGPQAKIYMTGLPHLEGDVLFLLLLSIPRDSPHQIRIILCWN